MINGIQLKNWRSHLDSKLDFSLGTNALLGPMGSGKSSIMNAICFGLFGTFPDLQSRKIKLDDIIMNKPSLKNESQISVEFSIGGKKYSVMRVIERNKGTTYSEIREGDKLLDAPNAQRVTELVEKLLKVNYELFSRAIYSEQNELDHFLRLPRGERMKRIDNLLMIDRFETARSNTVSLRNRLVERKNAKESVVDLKVLDELKKSIEDTEYSLGKLNQTKGSLLKETDERKIERENLENKLKEFEKFERELEILNKKKNSIEGSLGEIKISIDRYKKLLEGRDLEVSQKELKAIIKKIEISQLELDDKREELESFTKTISENEVKISFLEKKIKELQNKIHQKLELEEKISFIEKEFGKKLNENLIRERNEVEETQEKITEVLTKLEQIKESLSKITDTKDKCPVCESRISEEKGKI